VISAQGVTGRLEGTVVDPAGAMIPNAEIQVLNPATGKIISSKSDENGNWSVPSLNATTYTVIVAASGFKKGNFPDIVIQAGIPSTLDAKLEIGSAQQTVEASGTPESLQAATATVTATLTGRQISELPYTSRNAMDIVTAQPGTQTV
jgi:Carboxypeptidase regulatory-like domain